MLDETTSLISPAVGLLAFFLCPVGMGYLFGSCSGCCNQCFCGQSPALTCFGRLSTAYDRYIVNFEGLEFTLAELPTQFGTPVEIPDSSTFPPEGVELWYREGFQFGLDPPFIRLRYTKFYSCFIQGDFFRYLSSRGVVLDLACSKTDTNLFLVKAEVNCTQWGTRPCEDYFPIQVGGLSPPSTLLRYEGFFRLCNPRGGPQGSPDWKLVFRQDNSAAGPAPCGPPRFSMREAPCQGFCTGCQECVDTGSGQECVSICGEGQCCIEDECAACANPECGECGECLPLPEA
jgi:hypothetical protein